jgi:hypothetical protein
MWLIDGLRWGLMKSLVQPPAAFGTQPQKYSLALQAKGLKPGVRTLVKAAPQLAFTPEQLVIADSCNDATVYAIRSGGQDVLAGQHLPAAIFSAASAGMTLSMPTTMPGQEIVVEVSRPSGGDFTASMIGSVGGPPHKEPLVEVAEEAIKEIEVREAEEAKRAGGST